MADVSPSSSSLPPGVLLGLPATQYNANATNTPYTPAAALFAGAADLTLNLSAVLAGAGALTTPSAAQIIGAIQAMTGGPVLPGTTYNMRLINSSGGAFAWTVNPGAGVTLLGTMTIAQNTWRDFYVTVGQNGTVTLQSVGTGTFS